MTLKFILNRNIIRNKPFVRSIRCINNLNKNYNDSHITIGRSPIINIDNNNISELLRLQSQQLSNKSSISPHISYLLASKSLKTCLLTLTVNEFKRKNYRNVVDIFKNYLSYLKDNSLEVEFIDSRILFNVISSYALLNEKEEAKLLLESLPFTGFNFNYHRVKEIVHLDNEKDLQTCTNLIKDLEFVYEFSNKDNLMECLNKATKGIRKKYILELFNNTPQEYLNDDNIYSNFIKAFTVTDCKSDIPFKPFNELGEISLNCLLEYYAHLFNFRLIKVVLEIMKNKNIPVYEDSGSIILSNSFHTKNLELSLTLFEILEGLFKDKKVPLKVHNALLSGLLKLELNDVAKHVLSSIDNPNIVTYNILLKNSVIRNDGKYTIDIIKQLKSKGIKPDEYTFSILLEYFNKNNHPNSINIVISTMKDMNLNVDLYILTSMIDIMVKDGRLIEAENFLNYIEDELNFKTNSVTYTSLIIGNLKYAKYGLDNCLKLINRMNRKGLALTTPIMNAAIETSIINKQFNITWFLFNLMRNDHNVKFTKDTWFILLKGFKVNGLYNDCRSLLEYMQMDNVELNNNDDFLTRVIRDIKRKL